jgi:hypothetical protein
MNDPCWEAVWPAFEEAEPQIRLHAYGRGKRSYERIARAGHDTGELEVDALINSVFERLASKEIAWDPGEETIRTFFRRHVHNRVRYFELKNGIAPLAIVDGGQSHSDGWGNFGPGKNEVLTDHLGPRPEDALTQELYDLDQKDLLALIEGHSDELAELARLLLAGYSRAEIAGLMKRSSATIGRRCSDLGILVRRYQNACSGGPSSRPSEQDRATKPC